MKIFVCCLSIFLFSNQVLSQTPDFLPDAGLKLHLQADCIKLIENTCISPQMSSEIDIWYDLSGNENHAVATSESNKPEFVIQGTGNKPVVRFNGTELDGMLISDSLNLDTLDYTIFVVDAYTKVAGKRGRLLHSRTRTDWYLGRWNGKTSFSSGGQVKRTDLEADSSIDRFIISNAVGSHITTQFRNNLPIKQYFRNGDQVEQTLLFQQKNDWTLLNLDQSQLDPVAPGKLGIANTGGSLSIEQRATDGDIAEIIVYNRVLTDGERNLVTRYLSAKYNVALNRDSYTISFNYKKEDQGKGENRKIVHLAVDNQDSGGETEAIFQQYLWSESNQLQPENVAWYIDYTDPNSRYFTLQNLESKSYLTRNGNKTKLLETPFIKDSNGYLSYNEKALWSIRIMNNQGDIAIINKSGSDSFSEKYYLRIKQVNNSVSVQATNNLFGSSNYLNKLFSINQRYINLQIYPDDVFRYNDLLHLPNGLRVDSIFLPDYNNSDQTRLFKLTVNNNVENIIHEFISNIGFDVLSETLDSFQKSSVIAIEQRIGEMLKNKGLNTQVITDSILRQLSAAYKFSKGQATNYPFVPGIVWFSLNGSDEIPQLLESLTTEVDVNGKYIKLNFSRSSLPVDENIKFGMLLQTSHKSTSGGMSFGYTIYDPTIPSGPDPSLDPN